MTSDTPLTGSWVLSKQENFSEYLAANQVSWFKRMIATNSTPRLEIEQHGNRVKADIRTFLFSQCEDFTLGEAFEANALTLGGSTLEGESNWDGDKLVIVYRNKTDEKSSDVDNSDARVVEYEMTDDGQLLMTLTFKDVVAKRWFSKVESNIQKLDDSCNKATKETNENDMENKVQNANEVSDDCAKVDENLPSTEEQTPSPPDSRREEKVDEHALQTDVPVKELENSLASACLDDVTKDVDDNIQIVANDSEQTESSATGQDENHAHDEQKQDDPVDETKTGNDESGLIKNKEHDHCEADSSQQLSDSTSPGECGDEETRQDEEVTENSDGDTQGNDGSESGEGQKQPSGSSNEDPQ